MRIAQIAPLYECVPPPAYGGTELIVSLVTDELVRRGHDVTLFAAGNSQTLAKLESGCDQALRPAGIPPAECGLYDQMQVSKVFARAHEFDVIHSHVGHLALPFANLVKTPVVHTLHGILPPLIDRFFVQHRHQNYISISNSQRRNDLGLNYVATVYNAIAVDRFEFHAKPQDPPYLAFLGRISPEKGPHLAIEIAKKSGWQLKMAGKIDPVDREFYRDVIAPLIDGEQIQFLGEANHVQKNALMGGAVATLFPITWPEPFGLVMAESMASGTPVIAMSLGSAPEVIANGQTGFLCDSVDDCVAAIAPASQLDRQLCREHVSNRFNLDRMITDYEHVYNRLLAERFALNGHLKNTNLIAS